MPATQRRDGPDTGGGDSGGDEECRCGEVRQREGDDGAGGHELEHKEDLT